MTLIGAPGAALEAADAAGALDAADAAGALDAAVAAGALDAAVAGALEAPVAAAEALGALDDLLLLQADTSIAAEIPHRTSFPVRLYLTMLSPLEAEFGYAGEGGI
jgi:hypothetical protein